MTGLLTGATFSVVVIEKLSNSATMSLFNIKLATTQSQVQTGKASQSIIAKYTIESRASNRSLVKRCESAWMI